MSQTRSSTVPSIIITGASGFIGRHVVDALKDDFLIYALARRGQKQVNIPPHPNIKWLQVDISHRTFLQRAISALQKQGDIDFVLHLAGYYDFDYVDCPQYKTTNVEGTRFMLEAARALNVKRFIFASSIAACNFPRPGETITEKTPPDAEYPYAVSKKEAEQMLEDYSRVFPCSVVRLAAVYSDWCEYGPLYVFLCTWLSRQWNARILGGKGQSAVPYIHVKDLVKLFLNIIYKTKELPNYAVYNASPDGAITHTELFEIATRYYFRKTVKPFFMPKFIALPGVIARDILGRMTGNRPFERPWMLKYLDMKLSTDSTYTRQALDWQPTSRLHLCRRVLFLIEHMTGSPQEWHIKNQAALKHAALQPDFLIYEALLESKEKLLETCKNHILSPSRSLKYRHYQSAGPMKVRWYIGTIYQLLVSAVRTGDRLLIWNYAKELASIRFHEGFTCEEVSSALTESAELIIAHLLTIPELKGMEQRIHNHIALSMQLAVDEIEDCYEMWQKKSPPQPPEEKPKRISRSIDAIELEKQIREYENELQNQIQNYLFQ